MNAEDLRLLILQLPAVEQARLAKMLRADWGFGDDGEGTSGVREPRRPFPPESGAEIEHALPEEV